jgi:hypothetical protein
MTSDEAGKVYCARISPKAAWTLCVTIGVFNHKIRPRRSGLGKQSIFFIVVLI